GIWEVCIFEGEDYGNFRGDLLLLYTDGLNEAENKQQELFGNDAVIDLMTQAADCTAAEVIDILKKAVEKHREGTIPNDDLTMVCLRLLAP
ncbi:SpoIIE family protein phosphatase, partial [bacterium]|nr:SpoIIE family protein phosphatase [bacterium]